MKIFVQLVLLVVISILEWVMGRKNRSIGII